MCIKNPSKGARMTIKEIFEMARQAGVRDDEHTFEFSQYKYLERFAKLVVEKDELEDIDINITWNENSMRDFGKDELNFARAILRKAKEK